MKKNFKHWIIGMTLLLLLGVLSILLVQPRQQLLLETSYIGMEDSLREQLHQYANENKIDPIDAKVDRVWHAIPGYNGRIVNVEASYEKMKKLNRLDEQQIVYDEIPPNIQLKDLPPSPIYRGNQEKKMVALLVNVAWGEEFLPSMLETFRKKGVHATFFFDGSWIEKHPDLAIQIVEEGHAIGNHAYSHPDLKVSSIEKTTEELQRTNDAIFKTVGIMPAWFAPPSGSFNDQTVSIARELGMYTILWTVDTVDWKKPNPNEMVQRVVSKVENGSMVLMHPTDPTAQGLEKMITGIQEKGFLIGTVPELLSSKRTD